LKLQFTSFSFPTLSREPNRNHTLTQNKNTNYLKKNKKQKSNRLSSLQRESLLEEHVGGFDGLNKSGGVSSDSKSVNLGRPEVAEAPGLEDQLVIRRAIPGTRLESLGFRTVPRTLTTTPPEQRLYANGRHDFSRSEQSESESQALPQL
jgi:hypothetical protein